MRVARRCHGTCAAAPPRQGDAKRSAGPRQKGCAHALTAAGGVGRLHEDGEGQAGAERQERLPQLGAGDGHVRAILCPGSGSRSQRQQGQEQQRWKQ